MKLKDLIESNNTGLDAIKRAPIVDYDTGIRCLRIGDISNNRPFSEWGYSEVETNNYNKFQLKKGDIIIARTGATIGVNKFIAKDYNSVYNNGLIRLRIKKENNPKYVYYLLQSSNYKNFIKTISMGTSTQPNMQMNDLLNLEVPDFDRSKQDKIVEVLGKIDNKIELNCEISNNLHELLKNEYNKIFIEGKNENWIEDKLGNYLSVDRGLSYKGQFLSESGTPMINLGNIMPNGVFRIEKNKYYSGDYKDKVTIQVGDIAVANTDMTQNREVIGTPVIVPPIYDDNIIYSHHIYCLRNLKLPKMYVFYSLLTDQWNAIAGGSATGTTVLALPKETIENYNIAIPDMKSLALFDNIATNIQSKRESIMLENMKLEELRNSLLPKLMSGEIDLNMIEVQNG